MFFRPQQPYQQYPYYYQQQQQNFQQHNPPPYWEQAPPYSNWMTGQGPIPTQSPLQQGGYPGTRPQSPGMQLMSAFQTSEGKFDMQKAMKTVDLCVKTANQVSPLVKQVGSIFQTKT